MMPNYSAKGRHYLIELYDCPPERLRLPATSEDILLRAAAAMGATVVSSHFHAFSPHGVSGVIIIQESHLTIHTWPEHGYAAVDIFTCGPLDIEVGIALLLRDFGARRSTTQPFARGTAIAEPTPEGKPGNAGS